MKGIFILSFDRKPGAFVDREYPVGITRQLNIDNTEQNKVYSLHRMRNVKPNFLFLKAKGVQIASFYSGFDFKDYIGRPNQCVSIILEPNENPTKWEDILRRLTFELLPILAKIRGDEIITSGLSKDPKYEEFDRILGQYYQDLQAGNIQPMLPGEGEVKEGSQENLAKLIEKETTHNMAQKPSLSTQDIMAATKGALQAAEKPIVNVPVVPMDPIKAATMEMENMEKDGLRNEIRKLQKIIQEKEEKTRALEAQCRDLSTAGVSNSDTDVAKIRGEFEAHLATKEQELDTWRSKVAELNENTFINQDNIRKLTEMTMQQTEDMSKQMKTIMDLKKQIKVLQANQNVPQLDANEVSALRAHLTEVEESLKQTNQALEEKTTQNKTLFMKVKKAEEDMETLRTELEFTKQKLAVKERESSLPKLPQITIAPLGGNKPQSDAAQAKVLELEAQVRKLQADLSQAKLASSGLQVPSSDLELQYKTVQSELIDAKKTIKIQRREIENLQKLAGL